MFAGFKHLFFLKSAQFVDLYLSPIACFMSDAMGLKSRMKNMFVPLCLPAMYVDQGLAILQAVGVCLAFHIFLTGAIGAEEVKAIVQGVWKSFEILQGFVPGEMAKGGGVRNCLLYLRW